MFPLFQGYLLRQSLFLGRSRAEWLHSSFYPFGFDFPVFTFKVCRRMEKVVFLKTVFYFIFLENALKISFRAILQKSTAMIQNKDWWCCKSRSCQAYHSKRAVFHSKSATDFFSQPSSGPCLPFDTVKSISPQVSYQMCNDSWALSLQVRWAPSPCGSLHLWRKKLCSLFGFLNIKIRKRHNSERNVRVVHVVDVVEAPVPLQTIKLALVAPVDLAQGSLTQSFNARDPAKSSFCPTK